LEQWIIPFHADDLNTHLHTKNDLQKLQRMSLDMLGKMFLAPYVKNKKLSFIWGKRKKNLERTKVADYNITLRIFMIEGEPRNSSFSF